MSIFSVKKTNTASASLLLALSLVLVSGLSTLAAPKAAAPTRVANHSARNHISPPHAGVKLLEDILTRMRNLPQIAMSRNKQTFQYQGTQVADKQGATNQLLAIRPKENASKGKADNLSRQIAMGPQSYFSEGAKDREERDSRSQAISGSTSGGGFGGDGQSFAKQRKSAEAKAEPVAKPQSIAIARPGSRFSFAPSTSKMEQPALKQAASASASNGISVYPASSDAFASMGGESYGSLGASTKEITDRLSPEARRRFSNSTSKLFEVAKKLEDAQKCATQASKQSSTTPVRGAILADDKRMPQRNDIRKTSGQLLANTASGSGRIWSADEDAYGMANEKGRLVAQAAPVQASPTPESPALQKPPAEPSIYKHVREFLGTKGQSEGEIAEKAKPIEIALLPPSVVTGIPLVRLGTSETESNKALSSKGSINKTKINDWSVWSLQKPGAEDVSLQIYVRNGAVEAIRIFDSSLISTDFGVKLGDDLGTVKHKFGEPAFILSEPQSRAGQNYVYPISQVSFQLAYTSKTTPPKVVSLLIFNAK